ncbi:MAG: FtsQ-type POTRA domain-containing protein [Firmicutes bacterium]|nr:FtsQ-type POTRA domain-containing protein [Bacillota bacterium]
MKDKKAGGNIQSRHDQRRRKRIREQKIRRTVFFSVLILIAVLVVMFFTPLFNIRSVTVVGNDKVSTEKVDSEIGGIKGKNLFLTTKRSIVKKLSGIPYVEKVTVVKKPIGASVTVEIDEAKTIAAINTGSGFIAIDKNGKVLEKLAEKPENVPEVDGLNVTSSNEGEQLTLNDAEIQQRVMSCLDYMQRADIISGITAISFEDMTNITFNYQNRLDVICGTPIDFQRKLGLFKEAINSSVLTENSRGTINLSTTGKAIYSP